MIIQREALISRMLEEASRLAADGDNHEANDLRRSAEDIRQIRAPATSPFHDKKWNAFWLSNEGSVVKNGVVEQGAIPGVRSIQEQVGCSLQQAGRILRRREVFAQIDAAKNIDDLKALLTSMALRIDW